MDQVAAAVAVIVDRVAGDSRTAVICMRAEFAGPVAVHAFDGLIAALHDAQRVDRAASRKKSERRQS